MNESNLKWLRRIEISLLEAKGFLDCLEPEDELINQDELLPSIKQGVDNAWQGIKKILGKNLSRQEFEEGIPF